MSQSFNPQTGEFAILENPTLAKIFGNIVDMSGSGISPVELGIGRPKKAVPQPQPAPQQQAAPQPMQPIA